MGGWGRADTSHPNAVLDQWKVDSDLVGVRDPAELDKLPEAERQEWRALWEDVDALLGKCQAG